MADVRSCDRCKKHITIKFHVEAFEFCEQCWLEFRAWAGHPFGHIATAKLPDGREIGLYDLGDGRIGGSVDS